MIIQCYTGSELLESMADHLKAFFERLGREAKQGAVGFVIDGDYLELSFPLEPTE